MMKLMYRNNAFFMYLLLSALVVSIFYIDVKAQTPAQDCEKLTGEAAIITCDNAISLNPQSYQLLTYRSIAWSDTGSVKTLFCQDDKFPEFQYYLDFDDNSNIVFGKQSGRITPNTIEFTDLINGIKYDTVIYRSNGRFIVFVSGNTNRHFSGLCTLKQKNIF